MTLLVVFAEEPSAAIVVEELAKVRVPDRNIIVVRHEGKSDLRESYPRKIAAWRHPEDARFIILHDNDGAVCRDRKADLTSAIPRQYLQRTRVRLVMQELEAWYLGAPAALQLAGVIERADILERRAKFRDPDVLANAKQEFYRVTSLRGQLELARRIGPHLGRCQNRSNSFAAFLRLLEGNW